MAKNIPKDRLLPFEKLLIGAMVAELRGYSSQASRYSRYWVCILFLCFVIYRYGLEIKLHVYEKMIANYG